MRYLIGLAICTFFAMPAWAQMSADDAKGQTTIVNNSSSVAFNISDAVATVSWNNLRKLDILQSRYTLWGISASAKNKDGLADLLKTGNLTPESKIGGFLAFRWSFEKKFLSLSDKMQNIQNDSVYLKYKELTYYKDDVEKAIANSQLTTSERKLFNEEFLPMTDNFRADMKILIDKVAHHRFNPAATDIQKNIIAILTARQLQVHSLQMKVDALRKQEDSLQILIDAERKKSKTHALTAFIKTGLTGNSLSLYNATTTGSLSGRFDAVEFRGTFVDLGLNLDMGKHWVTGISVGYEHINNLDSLSQTSFTIKTSEKVGSDELSSSRSYTAYKGSYVIYDRVNLRTDALYYGKINDDYRLVWNCLYTRFMLPVEESRIRPVINAGTAVNFYKAAGKLVGGVYLQSNDVFNRLDSDNNFGARLSFGVVVKYSFESIFDRLAD
ncbi:hypothetical protein CLV57_3325 [Mucilaginibacter auburnensis]|uniref:Outer membrane protein with beta-barrel domain n=2 Tax=Mucilaginibacter auburnensis TaxID=1457233 RepID=A0A2H9VP99_9SPHI|nr:hypothetical protein CLV57_3325 [Mucilaginibacter auburnensis]